MFVDLCEQRYAIDNREITVAAAGHVNDACFKLVAFAIPATIRLRCLTLFRSSNRAADSRLFSTPQTQSSKR